MNYKLNHKTCTRKPIISHEDQEVDGLKFKTYIFSGDYWYISVTGDDNKVRKWAKDTNATEVDMTEITNVAKTFEVEQECLYCHSLYTPSVSITITIE